VAIVPIRLLQQQCTSSTAAVLASGEWGSKRATLVPGSPVQHKVGIDEDIGRRAAAPQPPLQLA
jgi:hypothetical protein